MISPELLRRYPFFGTLDDAQLKQIAMLAEEETILKGTTIFSERASADTLCVLMTGSVDLFFHSAEEFHPKQSKELFAGEINPGEVFGISALVEPYILAASARAAKDCTVIKIDAVALRSLLKQNAALGCLLMVQIAQTLNSRLNAARVQLAAAWAA